MTGGQAPLVLVMKRSLENLIIVSYGKSNEPKPTCQTEQNR